MTWHNCTAATGLTSTAYSTNDQLPTNKAGALHRTLPGHYQDVVSIFIASIARPMITCA